MNYIKKYNNEMGGIDISDQLSNYCKIDFWLRNRNWWWYIFFWDIGVILGNACIICI